MKCSFCENKEGTVQLHNKSICKDCLYGINIEAKEILYGSIYCNQCKHSEGFIVTFDNDVRVGYVYSGLDIKRHPIYSVSAVTGGWNKRINPKHIKCANCNSTNSIPLWILEYNKYVRKSIKEPTKNNK